MKIKLIKLIILVFRRLRRRFQKGIFDNFRNFDFMNIRTFMFRQMIYTFKFFIANLTIERSFLKRNLNRI